MIRNSDSLSIAMIGAGNLAWHLAPALDNTGYPVKEVYSRHEDNAAALVKKLYHAKVVSSLDFSESECRLFILAVSDDALESIATEIILPEDAMVAHTSGSQPLSILGYLPTENIGVFYPLQTFSKSAKVDFNHIPIFVEGETKEISDLLLAIGKSISGNVNKLGTIDRKVLHLAAVFACNFTNHLMTIAEDILSQKGLEMDYLHPLIAETMEKASRNGGYESQTGPAIRQDLQVLQQHILMLGEREDLISLYTSLTDSIQNYHEQNRE